MTLDRQNDIGPVDKMTLDRQIDVGQITPNMAQYDNKRDNFQMHSTHWQTLPAYAASTQWDTIENTHL